MVLDLDPIDGARTYINPQIIWASPETILHQEGSISMPGVNDEGSRQARVRISYQDIDGELLHTEESLAAWHGTPLKMKVERNATALDRFRRMLGLVTDAEARAVGKAP